MVEVEGLEVNFISSRPNMANREFLTSDCGTESRLLRISGYLPLISFVGALLAYSPQ